MNNPISPLLSDTGALASAEARRAARLAVLRLGTPALGLVTDYLVTDHVGLDGLGTYAVLTSVAALLSMVASLGMPGPLNRELALADGDDRARLSASAMAATALVWAVVSVLLMAPSGEFLVWWRSDSTVGEKLFLAALTGGLALQALAVAIGRGYDRLTAATIVDLIANKVVFIAGLLAISMGFLAADLPTILLLGAVAGFAPIITVLGWLAWRDGLRPVAPDARLARNLSVQSWALLGHQIVLTVSSGVALWILSSSEGPGGEAAGFFHVLTRLAALASVPGVVVQFLFGNRMAEAFAAGNSNSIEASLRRTVAASTSVAAVLAIALFATHRLLLDVLPADITQWSSVAPLLILLAGQLIQVATGPCGYSLIMAKKETSILAATAFGTLAASILAVVLIGPFGVLGAAIASSAGVVLINLANLVMSKRQVGLDTSMARRL